MFLVDTNVVSELRRPTVNPGVRQWIEAADVNALFMSVVTDYELERGALLMEARDPVRARSLRAWQGLLRDQFRSRMLDVTPAIARECAALNVPNPRPLAESLIAATALHHRMAVVTRNERDFNVPWLRVINPFR